MCPFKELLLLWLSSKHKYRCHHHFDTIILMARIAVPCVRQDRTKDRTEGQRVSGHRQIFNGYSSKRHWFCMHVCASSSPQQRTTSIASFNHSSIMSDAVVRTLSSTSVAPPATTLEKPHEGFEVDLHLHEAIGYLAGNYPCMFGGTKGTLFAGSGGVSFVGWTFFFQKRVDINWGEVLQVVKTQRVDCGNAISFIMRDNVEYDFYGIQHSERVWPVLVNLHNESLHSPNREPLMTPLRKSLRRMSTDPIYATTPHQEQSGSPSGTEAAYVAAATVASNDEFRASVSARNLAAISVASRRSRLMSSPVPLEGEETEISADLQQAWNELQKGGSDQESYATSAIEVSRKYVWKLAFNLSLYGYLQHFYRTECFLAL